MIKSALLKSLGFTDAFIEQSLNNEELNEIIVAHHQKTAEILIELKEASRLAFSKLMKEGFSSGNAKRILSQKSARLGDLAKNDEEYEETALNSERQVQSGYQLQLKEDSDFSVLSKSNSSNCCHFQFYASQEKSTGKPPSTTPQKRNSVSDSLKKSDLKKQEINGSQNADNDSSLLLIEEAKLSHKCNFPGCYRFFTSSDCLSNHLEMHLMEIRQVFPVTPSKA